MRIFRVAPFSKQQNNTYSRAIQLQINKERNEITSKALASLKIFPLQEQEQETDVCYNYLYK